MNRLWEVPISSIVGLSPERAVAISRDILRAECSYTKLSPSALTISSKLMTPDGGIDAEINTPEGHLVPQDCIYQSGLTGFQIKSGGSFKPWTPSSIRSELLNNKGVLSPAVRRLLRKNGHYTIICTGHDLTPEQRNNAINNIKTIFHEQKFKTYEGTVNVFGASQIAEFAERYPGTASFLITDPIQEAWTLAEWQQDAHMTNKFVESEAQTQTISHIRAALNGQTKHVRLLGEPGLGKTRIVLESLKDESLSPYVLYIQHGSLFGQTNLFRQLLKSGREKPLILVIDELPESELSDIWRHLKLRCGHLKIVSLDHGRDETYDEEIDRLNVPHLPDNVIKEVLANRIGESPELDRWVAICEGSPRVAQAVADNIHANPADLLKPPTTVPIWTRFLHGYSNLNKASSRQIDCVAQHLALFSRFGFDAPVETEAKYISELIQNADSSISWARFQEIVQDLRARRVLQGSRTLFFVPKALHIYLWTQFWSSYGRGFDFLNTFSSMPESLHVWFMSLFKYAGEADTAHIIEDILKPDGIFTQNDTLTSDKGSKFLSVLAEANPAAVLKLLESTIGGWSDDEIFNLANRQTFVWTLEKIAVWPSYTVRAMQLLIKLAVNENASHSNNATGTLLGLFKIGPEWAVTESTPETRLPALLKLLRSQTDAEKLLGLKAAEAALDSHGMGFRVVGPEYQGLKERAKLWIPKTYGDWWHAHLSYFQALVHETKTWPPRLRSDVCDALLNAVKHQIKTKPCTQLAFKILDELVNDDAMLPEKLNQFFSEWQEYENDDKYPEISKRIKTLARRYTQRDLASRFNRYVLDVSWLEWDDEYREKRGKPKKRAKALVKALARRIAISIDNFLEVSHLLALKKSTPALSFFAEQLAKNDLDRSLLPKLIDITVRTKDLSCLFGYLVEVKNNDSELYTFTINGFLETESTAWIGVHIALNSKYDDSLFLKCLSVLDKEWVSPEKFSWLRGNEIESVPKQRVGALFQQLNIHPSDESPWILIYLLDQIPFNDDSPFDAEFVFSVVSKSIPAEERIDTMKSYHWKNVCQKLVQWDKSYILPMLDALLTQMGNTYRLSYDRDVEPLATELLQASPSGAWGIIKKHFEYTLPKWRSDLLNWLKGGIGGFDDKEPKAPIADLPLEEILDWVDQEPESRAGLIAHAAPATLNDVGGGKLTRAILHKYQEIDGVLSGVSANFHSGGWVGSTSNYLKHKREKFREWLAAGFDYEVTQWVESEIEYLDRQIESEEINEERSQFD